MLSISEYFAGKNVFITGGSGFVGKGLIEILLRCSPNIGNIYILIREKRGKSSEERVQEITDNPLFDTVKRQQPKAINKIIPILGDITKLRLGISEQDEHLFISKINIIYHVAASVRFDDLLRVAIFTNLRSTRELVSLALKCDKLEVFAYISTSYSNSHMSVIDEKCYPSFVRWQDAIDLAEQNSPHLESLTLKYIAPLPNTYTFTKNLAENAVVDMCQGKIPFIILRPSIIVNTATSPIPGWIDNLNGPFALSVAGMKGISSAFIGRPDSALDIVFLDNVVKALVIAVWKEGTRLQLDQIPVPSVYNITTDVEWLNQWFMDLSNILLWKVPFTGRLWHVERLILTGNFYYYQYLVIFKHVIPAMFIDALIKLTGGKPIVLKYTRRLYIANDALQFFTNNSFTFLNKNYLNLEKSLLECEQEDFKFYRKPNMLMHEEVLGVTMNLLTGIKRYVLCEPYPAKPETFRNTYRLYYLNLFVKVLAIGFFLYLIFWKMDILTVITERMKEYIEKL